MKSLRIELCIAIVLLHVTSCANSQQRPQPTDDDLQQLFGLAVSGIPNPSSVHSIAESNSAKRVQLLVLIANGPYTSNENRDAAIDDLAKIGNADALEGIAELLAPHQGAGLRLHAAKALKNPGCTNHCIKMVLFYFYRIFVGEQALRDQVFNDSTKRVIEEDQQQVLTELRELLIQHQNEVLGILTTTYGLGSAEPAPFSLHIVEQLRLTQGCDLLLKSADGEQKMNRFMKTDPASTTRTIEKLGCRELKNSTER